MQLESGIKQAGKQELNWDTTSLASGIYFIQLKTKEQLFSKKIVISK